MKILSVSGHGCIRATKMNLALIQKGYDVHFLTKRQVPYAINYKSHAIGEDRDQMREAMKIYEPHVDLCHAHNEPSWYVSLWKFRNNKKDEHKNNKHKGHLENIENIIRSIQCPWFLKKREK